jgi:hypothetical protein
MKPRSRKVALIVHISFSVGWLGAVLPYLALSIVGLTSHDPHTVSGAYLSMKLIGWSVIVPLSLAALLSGLVESLGTQWGLVRHWWILIKFVLTIFATFVLLRHMQKVSVVANMAPQSSLSDAGFHAFRFQLFIHPAGGLLVLLGITAISVFKPWGLTPFAGQRIAQSVLPSPPKADIGLVQEPHFAMARRLWPRVVGFHVIGLGALLLVILHLTHGGMRGF